MSSFSRFRSYVLRFWLGSTLLLATAAFGGPVSLQRARVTVDARDPSAPHLEIEVTASSGSALSEIDLYLATAVEVTSASVEGRKVEFASSDVPVQGSIRVMPAAAMMGQAAGTAAVQSLHTGQPACDLDTAQLVETLRQNDAYLPQDQVRHTMTRST